MCGIVGAIFVDPQPLVEAIINPLQKLEYRGYDSCGYVTIADEITHYISKHIGSVEHLKQGVMTQTHVPVRAGPLVTYSPVTGIKLAIAHTRWATHGAVTVENTHPIQSEQVYVVHNGIIDNHDELKKKLKDQGYKFKSETDTEVIAHLISVYRKMGADLYTAVSSAVVDLKGKYSFLAIDVKKPDSLVAVKRGRPLILYSNPGANYVASDVSAFENLPDGRICFPDDEAVVEISTLQHRADHELLWNEYSPEKSETFSDKLRTIMESEILQQPDAIRNTLEIQSIDEIASAFHRLTGAQDVDFKLLGCGTSYNAADLGARWLRSACGMRATAEISSEYAATLGREMRPTIYVLISQSGETADTLAALEKIEGFAPRMTISICNVPHSELVRRCAFHVMMSAGTERSVASTKAFTAQLTAILKLSLAAAAVTRCGVGSMPFIIEDMKRDILQLPTLVSETLANWSIKKFKKTKLYKNANLKCAFFLGRGNFFPIAHEGALKMSEIAYVPSLTFSTGELKHGPLALVEKGIPIFTMFSSKEEKLESLFSSISQAQARGGLIFLITDADGFAKAKLAGLDVEGLLIPTVARYEQYVYPMLSTIMLQLVAHELALTRNDSIDKPRNLAKSVTV